MHLSFIAVADTVAAARFDASARTYRGGEAQCALVELLAMEDCACSLCILAAAAPAPCARMIAPCILDRFIE
jgi:hypothetical protein